MTLNKIILILTVFYFFGCSTNESQYKIKDCSLRIDVIKMTMEEQTIDLEITLLNNGHRDIFLPSIRTSIGVRAFEVLTLITDGYLFMIL